MIRRTFAALALCATQLLLAGCPCGQHVNARAVVGSLSDSDCMQLAQEGGVNLPYAYTCPGGPITLCYGADGVSNTTITIDPEPDPTHPVSGSYPRAGHVTFSPTSNTTITVRASDCATTTKVVNVINGPTISHFDGHWDDTLCSSISYDADARAYDPRAMAIKVEAKFVPRVDLPPNTPGGMSGPATCTTPPFLDGHSPDRSFNFDIQRPNIPRSITPIPLTRPRPLPSNWLYGFVATCDHGITCPADAVLPFDMTLICP